MYITFVQPLCGNQLVDLRKVIRIPESVGSGILGFTIRNPAEGIQNPTNDWNPGSEWNPKSR